MNELTVKAKHAVANAAKFRRIFAEAAGGKRLPVAGITKHPTFLFAVQEFEKRGVSGRYVHIQGGHGRGYNVATMVGWLQGRGIVDGVPRPMLLLKRGEKVEVPKATKPTRVANDVNEELRATRRVADFCVELVQSLVVVVHKHASPECRAEIQSDPVLSRLFTTSGERRVKSLEGPHSEDPMRNWEG